MTKLYKKSEILFAIIWIIVYVVGSGVAETLSEKIGVEKSAILAMHTVLSAVLLVWLCKSGLAGEYGLRRSDVKASKFLFYIPLVILSTCNLWLGIKLDNFPLAGAVCYFLSMLLTGFLEEIIFRGLLFRAMCKSGVKSAIIVSSLTFGMGHIVNLLNGNSDNLPSTLLQLCYAAAIGFMFVAIYYKGGSLLPCIIMHGVFNALGVFADRAACTGAVDIIVSLVLVTVSASYAAYVFVKVGTPHFKAESAA